MVAEYRALLGSLTLRPPANEESIQRLQDAVRAALPNPYLNLLRFADGGEGSIGDNYIVIDRAEDLTENPYPYAKFVPGLFFFGGDGAEAMFGFDLGEGSDRVLVIHSDDLEPNHIVELSPSLLAFFELLHKRFWSDVWRERYRRILH